MNDAGRTDNLGNKEFIVISTGGAKKYFNKKRIRNPSFTITLPKAVNNNSLWYTNLIKDLRQARLSTQLTQFQLGKLIHSNQAAISRFELGKVKVTTDFLDRIIVALKLKIKIEITKTS